MRTTRHGYLIAGQIQGEDAYGYRGELTLGKDLTPALLTMCGPSSTTCTLTFSTPTAIPVSSSGGWMNSRQLTRRLCNEP